MPNKDTNRLKLVFKININNRNIILLNIINNMSDNLIDSLASLTKNIQEFNYKNSNNVSAVSSSVDLTGIEDIPDPESFSHIEVPNKYEEDTVVYDKPTTVTLNKYPNKSFNESVDIGDEVNYPENVDYVIDEERRKETDEFVNMHVPTNKEDPHNEFRVDIKELARIEDLITEYNNLIKKLRTKKMQLRKKTIQHMERHDIGIAKMKPDGSDKFNLVKVKNKVNPMTKKRLPDRIKDYFVTVDKLNQYEAKKKADSIIQWLNENTEYTVTTGLRRYKRRRQNIQI